MGGEEISLSGGVPSEFQPAANDKSDWVPLTVYIGETRRLIGTARISEDRVEAYVQDGISARLLSGLVTNGAIRDVSIAFNTPPAHPVSEDGCIRWMKNF